MKLKNELPEMKKRFSAILTKIETYAPALYASGNYNDFITRLSWDALRACYTPAEICGLYEKYNCNDVHITSAARAALLSVYPGTTDFIKGGK